MKILIICEFFPTGKDLKYTGGVESRTLFVARKLAKKHHITILTNRLNNAKEKEKIFGFNVLRVGKRRRYKAAANGFIQRISFIIDCVRASKDESFDLVEGTNFITHLTAYIIAKIKNTPVIAWYPDVWVGHWIENTGFITGIFGEILERINLKLNFNVFIAISKITKIKLQAHTNKKITVISCGVEPDEFKKKVKKQRNKIICISRMAKYKNIKDLILAFALLHKSNSTLKLTIIGVGPQEKNLRDLAKNLRVKNSVSFLSNLSRRDLVKQLSQSYVFCLPTQVEGFGISIMEAAAAQTPYVATNISVLKEVTKNYRGGLSYKVGDINSLASKLNTLMTDVKIYRQKKSECIKLAKFYNWNKIANETEKAYQSIL